MTESNVSPFPGKKEKPTKKDIFRIDFGETVYPNKDNPQFLFFTGAQSQGYAHLEPIEGGKMRITTPSRSQRKSLKELYEIAQHTDLWRALEAARTGNPQEIEDLQIALETKQYRGTSKYLSHLKTDSDLKEAVAKQNVQHITTEFLGKLVLTHDMTDDLSKKRLEREGVTPFMEEDLMLIGKELFATARTIRSSISRKNIKNLTNRPDF